VRIDVRRFPLIEVALGDRTRDDELAYAFETLDRCGQRALAARVHYAALVHGRGGFTPLQRKAIARELARVASAYRPWDLGSYVAVSDRAVQGTVTALQWLLPQLRVLHVHPDLAAATRAAVDALVAKNGAAPQSLP
jgi:hypothetical protein